MGGKPEATGAPAPKATAKPDPLGMKKKLDELLKETPEPKADPKKPAAEKPKAFESFLKDPVKLADSCIPAFKPCKIMISDDEVPPYNYREMNPDQKCCAGYSCKCMMLQQSPTTRSKILKKVLQRWWALCTTARPPKVYTSWKSPR